jgi:uncharacterized protein (TIGR03086 family)
MILAPQDRPRSLNVLGEQVTVLAPAERTGSFEIFFQSGPEGVGPAPHSHPWDEAFYVLRGEIHFEVAGTEQTVGAGATVFIPGGTMHCFRLGDGGAEALSITSRHGAASVFAAIDEQVSPDAPDLATFVSIALAHGIDVPLPPTHAPKLDAIEALKRAHDHLIAAATNVPADALAKPSACEQWDLRALLNHILGGGWMFTLANQGKAVGEDGGDLVGEDHAQACVDMAAANLASWRGSDALDGERAFPFGTFPAPMALLINVGEITVHAWDLAKSTGQGPTIDPDVAELLLDFYLSMPLEEFRAHGAFGPEIEIDPAAPAADRMLALLGFQP